MLCFEESIKAIRPTASVSSHEERRLCRTATCQSTGIKKGGGALEGPEHLHAAQTSTGTVTHPTVMGLWTVFQLVRDGWHSGVGA